MEENKLGDVMLLSGIVTVIFWMISTSFSTHAGMMNFLFQTYGWTMVILAVCVLLVVLLALRNDKDSKVFIVFGTILVIGLSVAAYLFFGKVDNHVYIREVQEATVYLGGLI